MAETASLAHRNHNLIRTEVVTTYEFSDHI